MKKAMVTHSIITFVIVLLCVILMKISVGELEKQGSIYTNYLGTDIIIGSDTLQVVDYSMFKETLTLENGVEVNINYIKNK